MQGIRTGPINWNEKLEPAVKLEPTVKLKPTVKLEPTVKLKPTVNFLPRLVKNLELWEFI
jgi:hypothetical protein